jgi:hypothetical protein
MQQQQQQQQVNNSTTKAPLTVSKSFSNSSPSKTGTSSSNTLQPKKSSSSPLSKIKFHSISKRRFSGQKLLNLNEKFQLINKKNCTSSSSFIGSDDYDYINYGTAEKSNSSGVGKSSSSLKKYFMKFASNDRTSNNSDAIEARNLFHLKRHNHYRSQNNAGRASTTSDDNEFDVLNF